MLAERQPWTERVRGLRANASRNSHAELNEATEPDVDDPAEFGREHAQLKRRAGIRAGNQVFHLKLVDEADPSIEFVDRGDHFHLYFETDDAEGAVETFKLRGVRVVRDVHDTPWGTREFVVNDDQGHTLYFGQDREPAPSRAPVSTPRTSLRP